MLYQIFLFSCIVVTGFAQTEYECPSIFAQSDNVKVYGHNCYEFVVNRRKDFSDAQSYCEDNGGNLALVVNEGINNFITDTLKTEFNVWSKPFWIGLQYFEYDTTYTWVDDTELGQYHNFDESDVLHGDSCVAVIPKSTLWSRYECETEMYRDYSKKKRFICEYPAIPITTATALPTKLPNQAISIEDCPKLIRRDKYLQVFGNKCYMFEVNPLRTFTDADKHCQYSGGRLATIDSAVLDNFIQTELYHTYRVRDHAAWIGLRYNQNHGSHFWLDGARMSFRNFRHTTFYTSDECAAISAHDGKWLTKDCSKTSLPFVCEFMQVPHSSPKLPPTSTTPPPTSTKTGINSHRKITRDDCPVRANKYLQIFGKKCYKFEMKPLRNFIDADKHCQLGGGRLATIDSAMLDNFIQTELYHTYRVRDHAAWIGLRYNQNHGSHFWLDGARMSFRNFRHTTFYTSDECAAISAHDGKWLTKDCSKTSLPFVCEFMLAALPSPKLPTSTITSTSPSTTITPKQTTTTISRTTSQRTTTTPKQTTTTISRTTSQRTTTTTPTPTQRIQTTAEPRRTTMTTRTTRTRQPTVSRPSTTPTSVTTTSANTTPAKTTTEHFPIVKTTCPDIVCDLDCGLDGYVQTPNTGCMECKCNF